MFLPSHCHYLALEMTRICDCLHQCCREGVMCTLILPAFRLQGKNYTTSRKRRRKKCWGKTFEKSHKSACACMPNVLACLSKPERPDLPKFGTTAGYNYHWRIIVLSLRGIPWRLYRAKYLPSWNGTYGDKGFYSAQTSYLSRKVLTLVKNENI